MALEINHTFSLERHTTLTYFTLDVRRLHILWGRGGPLGDKLTSVVADSVLKFSGTLLRPHGLTVG